MAIALEGSAAHGLGALVRRSLREDVARLKRMAQERGVERIVVGLPLNRDGSVSPMALEVRRFGERLRSETGIAVFYQDERLTSFEAEERLKQRGMSLKRMLEAKRQGAVDEMAAVIVLEDYLAMAGDA